MLLFNKNMGSDFLNKNLKVGLKLYFKYYKIISINTKDKKS